MSDEMKVERFVPGVEYCRDSTVYAGVMNARADGFYVRYSDYMQRDADALVWQSRAERAEQQLAAAREALQEAEADAAKWQWLRKRSTVSMMMLADDVAFPDMNSEPYMTDGIDSYVDNCIATLQRDRQP